MNISALPPLGLTLIEGSFQTCVKNIEEDKYKNIITNILINVI